MKPYYQDDAVTIIHGDCREIMPTLEPVDLVLPDPPYGVDGTLNSRTARLRGHKKNPPRNPSFCYPPYLSCPSGGHPQGKSHIRYNQKF